MNPRAGATVVGAREFLIAYNINLNTRDRRLAHEIALCLRESGRARRDAAGEIERDAEGRAVQEPGRFPHVKAVGWYVEDHGCAQISINFTNFKVTPVHVVFDEACREADRLGLRVTGSELVGLIPEEALLVAGRHYLARQGKSPGVPVAELVRTAVRSLGLGDVTPFDPARKVVEYRVSDPRPSLVRLDVRRFVDEVSMDSPAPGGGSVAALCGALSAALSAMAANLTVGRKGYEAAAQEMRDLAVRAQQIKDELLGAVDEDTRAFDAVMTAGRLPRSAPERDAAIERAAQEATRVPLGVLERCVELLDLAERAVERGNKNSMSDAGVAALAAEAAATGAAYNVLINLPGIRDEAFAADARRRARAARDRVAEVAARVRARVEAHLG
jgi:glutamate formiminotransferase/formiminotetrahydrofolate cyclodeaminase